MSYCQFLAHLRQAVFCLAVIFLCSLAAQISAQEVTNDESKLSEYQKAVQTETIQSTDETDEPKLAVNRSQFTNEILTVKNFDESLKPKRERFRDSSFSQKTQNQQQSQPEDDTMMGVMGKGTEGVKLGGHVGFVVPVVGRGGGVTTNVGDRFVFGFPVGLTVKTKNNIAVDFEFIPTFNTGRDFVLTIHPGIIYGFKKKYAVGVRAAYDAGAGSYGFTPLISRGFKINEKVGFFIEADFPIRSNYRAHQDRFGSIAFATHAGFAF